MKLKNLRWWVITLIAIATVINYIDRSALAVLWPDIVEDLFPDESAFERKQIYANISMVFILSYAFGQAIFGKIFDWVGTRLGFVLSIGVWSLATAAHAFAQGVLSFSILVPDKRTCLSTRYLQLWCCYWRYHCYSVSGLFDRLFQLANGLCCYWFGWFIVAYSLDYIGKGAT